MADRLTRCPLHWRCCPDDRSLSRERPLRSVQGECEARPRRQDLREAQQEPAATDVECPSLEAWPGVRIGLIGDRNFAKHAKPGRTDQTSGDQQGREILVLVLWNSGEGQAVGNAVSILSLRLSNPGYLRFHLKGALLPFESNPKPDARGQVFGQFHACPPLTKVASPACFRSKWLMDILLDQQRQLNRVSPKVVSIDVVSHKEAFRSARRQKRLRPKPVGRLLSFYFSQIR